MFFRKDVDQLNTYNLPSQKAWKLSSKHHTLKLDWNETTIPPSPMVKEGILKFIDEGRLNWYPELHNEKLIKELADYNCIDEKFIQYFAGSDSLHEYLVRAFLEKGDRLMIVGPTYDHFRALAQSFGVEINFHYLDEDYQFKLSDFLVDIERYSPKVVYLVNPNNPTGNEYDLKLVENILKNSPNTLFILDEAYYEFSKHTSKELTLKYSNIIITRTFSKAFGLASFRIGYCIACEDIIAGLNKIRNPKNISALAQIAAINALKDKPYMESYVSEVLKSKDFFAKSLKELGVRTVHGGGNYILLELEKSIREKLLPVFEKQNIFIRDFSNNQRLKDFIRISVGTKTQMLEVFEIIKKAINSS